MVARIGQSQLRFEDDALVRGVGSYTGDERIEGEVAMFVVRSPVAAGIIRNIDTEAARAAPGVIAIFTGKDAEADGLKGFLPRLRPPKPDGSEMFVPLATPLRPDRVRHVGDYVAIVVAETAHEAENAAELVELDIDPLPAVCDAAEAVAEGAPNVWDEVPGNIAFVGEQGDREKVEAGFAAAAHIVRHRLPITRVTAATMEPRGAVGWYDATTGIYNLRVGTQATHRMQGGIAESLDVDRSLVRVYSRQCGGSFGMRNNPFPEDVLLLWAARKTGRTIRWASTRTEAFLTDAHAREQFVDAELALDSEGRFLAMRLTMVASIGAYYGLLTTQPLFGNTGGLAGVYRTPAIHLTIKGVHTNTPVIGPYRGAGRPEATYVMERMADLAAAELGMDRVEIRRRNMIGPEEMPFKTGLTFTYDSGDFPTILDKTLAAADWPGFAARREASRRRGLLRGIGISNPIEVAGGPPNTPQPEFARLSVRSDGKFVVHLGSGDAGQGHTTTFRQIVGDRFGAEPEDIIFVAGDTGIIERGIGTFGSRTVGAGGTSLAIAGDEVIRAAKDDAADALEVSAEDLVFEDGAFTVAGTDRRIRLTDLAARRQGGYEAEHFGATDNATFPNGCHVCEVEIDPETGTVTVDRYTVVDDVGVVVNPLLVKGQIQGGVVQGLGQALGEQIVYDESGQLLSASFMDYTMPRADMMPSISVASHAVPTKVNRLGAKGAGEAGTVGALVASINAVCDALSPLGIRHFDMPATPHRIWQAIQEAGGAGR